MFGESTNRNGFGKYSSNPIGFGSVSDLGKNINETNNLFSSRPFGPPTSGSIFGGSVGCVTGQGQQGLQLKNATPFGPRAGGLNSNVENMFAKAAPGTYNGGSMFGAGGFGFGGSSSSSVIGEHQPVGSMSGQGSSDFSFGKTTLAIDGASGRTSSSFVGSFGSKSHVGGFATELSRTSSTFGENSLVSGSNNFLPSGTVIASSKPYIPNGHTFTFGSKLPTFGITNTSKIPAFGNTGNATPAPAFAFGGASTASNSYISGSFGSKSHVGGFATESSQTNSTFGENSFVSGSNIFLPSGPVIASSKPYIPNGDAFTFGPKLPPFGITSTSKTHELRNTCNAAPAPGFAFGGASVASNSYLYGNSAFQSVLMVGGGGNTPSGSGQGGGNKPKYYTTTAMVDNIGKKTGEKLQSVSAMPSYETRSHEELRWEEYQCNRGINWDYSSVQPTEKIGAKTDASLPTGTGSNIRCNTQLLPSFSVETLAFTSPNAKGFGSVTGPCRIISPDCCTASRSSVWLAVPQPAQVSMPTTHIPVPPPSPFGQSSPSFSCVLERGKLAQGTEALLDKDPLQMTQGSTLSIGLLDGASISSQPEFNHISPMSSSGDVQPPTVANPFGTPSASESNPISLVNSGSTSLGISSMPVVCKATPARTSSLLTCRHLSRRRIKLADRKPPPIDDGPKVPFFISHDEFPCPKKGHSWINARENPKAWMANPALVWSPKESADATSSLKDETKVTASSGTLTVREEKLQVNDLSNIAVVSSNQRTVSEEHETSQLPKLQSFDYYTEPSMEELAATEKADPGYLSRVKDFVVGRHGYGHIMFDGETDVRQLDIESVLKFHHREVIVYMDESTKPPVGHGLNKPAEISLLNIKVVNRKTGDEYRDGEKGDKYKEMLVQKCKNSGAKFISYDPVAGEWKFSVPHFGC